MGRECVEGGVEDRGQVKPKHGAKEKQSPPPTFLTSLHTIVNTKGQNWQAKFKAVNE